MMKNGIDVSKYQENIAWKQVKDSGIDFAIIKAGGSDDGFYIDPTWYDLGAESPKKEEKETPPSCGCCCG